LIGDVHDYVYHVRLTKMPTPMIVYAQLAHYIGKVDISQKDAVNIFWEKSFAKLRKEKKQKLLGQLLGYEGWPSRFHKQLSDTCESCKDRAVIPIGNRRLLWANTPRRTYTSQQYAYCPCPVGQKERAKRSKPVVKSEHGRGSRRRA
jgi:hypothetical protein